MVLPCLYQEGEALVAGHAGTSLYLRLVGREPDHARGRAAQAVIGRAARGGGGGRLAMADATSRPPRAITRT